MFLDNKYSLIVREYFSEHSDTSRLSNKIESALYAVLAYYFGSTALYIILAIEIINFIVWFYAFRSGKIKEKSERIANRV